jgi:orotate phosphoribosyltransferase
MSHESLLQLIEERRGHFRMESGYHSERWFDLNRMFIRESTLRPDIIELARRLRPYGIDAVCGPETGGGKLAEYISRELGVNYLFTERFENGRAGGIFPVTYRVPARFRADAKGRTIAIVDDAISAGSTVRGTWTDLADCGARPVVLGALIVFGGNAAKFAAEKAVELESVTQMDFGMWLRAECPLCRQGIPIQTVSDAVS